MTTAREVISNALTFGLNRLAPGETLDPETGARCLDALNDIADEINGAGAFLFREILTASSAITGASALLGTAWPTLAPGVEILGATYQYTGGMDIPMDRLTMAQYANIAIKPTASMPQWYAPDGLAMVYFYPACTGQTVTLRTKDVVSDFADLDTVYSMPKGWKSALSALLAKKMAPTMLAGGVTAAIEADARAASRRLESRAVNPAIIAGVTRGNILTGFR